MGMINKLSLGVYKNKPAIIKEFTSDKIHIEIEDSKIVKVRDKDIEPIHPGPAQSISALEKEAQALLDKAGAVRDAWELLEAEGSAVSLKELADLCFGEFSPASAWAVFRLLCDNLYFSGTVSAISPRKRLDVEAEEKKRQGKQRESGEREEFLDELRRRMKSPAVPGSNAADMPPFADSRFIQDVEALAWGKSIKSKTMRDLGLSETPEDAHALLLNTGFWTVLSNPHPSRCGVSLGSAQERVSPPPAEERRDLTALVSLAIDNSWSSDPDDAVSVEESGTRRILYVHVADPASSIGADSPCEREARDRGVTLYIPEGNVWMLSHESLPLFGLGLQETSPALTFKIILDELGEIAETEIFPSLIKVRRLTYENADGLLSASGAAAHEGEVASALVVLNALADKNMQRRSLAGAISIDLPETHISLVDGKVNIKPIAACRSSGIVRECMLLAGEATARWVINRGFESGDMARESAFPFVSQEAGDMPVSVLDGYAGSYQLRRCMRPRTLSLKPGPHWGLGLDSYTQVTSPLRRYTDLLAHIQLRAFLGGEKPLTAEEVSRRLAAAEAAALASVHAERASRAHWTMVFLSDKKDTVWDAIALEKKIHRWVFVIPALALETQVSLRRDVKPNDEVKLVLKSVNIPRCEAVFAEA